MKKKLLFGASVALGICLFWLLLGKSEPVYRGTKLTQWMWFANWDKLTVGLAQIGPEAIPYLCKALKTQDTLLNKTWDAVWPKLPAGARRRFAGRQPVLAR